MEYFIKFKLVNGEDFCYDFPSKEKLNEEFDNIVDILKNNRDDEHISIICGDTIVNYSNVISIEAVNDNK